MSDALLTRFEAFREAVWTLWLSGGWAMAGIAAVALVMFALGTHIFLDLRRKELLSMPESRWSRWFERPTEGRGALGELLGAAAGSRSFADVAHAFEQFRATELAPCARELVTMRICVGAAPLVGLLGTVTGMLTTFGALATGSGGEQTMALVAGGISEALITTKTGLVIALPGLFMQYQLTRALARSEASLARGETLCTHAFRERAESVVELVPAAPLPAPAVPPRESPRIPVPS